MASEELIVQVMLKPNCGLENTRAALVVRRIAPLCETVSCHPRTVKSDRDTVSFLRDHGLFIRFRSSVPEQVLLSIRGAFFVDRCTIVEDAAAIPAYEASPSEDGTEKGSPAFSLPSAFAGKDGSKRDDELLGLLARFEEVHRKLRKQSERAPQDRELHGIVYAHAQAVDGLRTSVSRSRVESFNRIAPSLRTLAEDYGQRFGVLVDLDIPDGHVTLDRSVLALMEETIKRVIRSCIRDGIESPKERAAAGKPARATIRLRVENDGSDVICRIGHDGYPFNPQLVGEIAAKRGLLTRPLSTYTDEELGALALLPGFGSPDDERLDRVFSQFSEIGSMLHHVGGRGFLRRTEQNSAEVTLYFPVPFTIIEAALLRTGRTLFALPAQQIAYFEAYRPDRVEEPSESAARKPQPPCARTMYVCEDGSRYPLINGPGSTGPFATTQPAFVVVLDISGVRRCLAVDVVDGYESISVSQLPALLDRASMRQAGCIGYAVLKDGSACAVVSARHVSDALPEKGEGHA